MRRKLALLGFLAAQAMGGYAAPVTPTQASNAVTRALVALSPPPPGGAHRFANPYGEASKAVRLVREIEYEGGAVGYAADLEPAGFFVLPADDELPPWKLRAEDGAFTNMPPAFAAVLQAELAEDLQAVLARRQVQKPALTRYAKQWKAADLGIGVPAGDVKAAGATLLSTTWDQGSPYNTYCPSASGGPGGRAYAGCTACAVAQILRYHGQPSAVLQDHSYTDSKGASQGTHAISDAGTGAYGWADMPASISSGSSLAQRQSVGQLMYHAAVALESDFEADGTGAYPSGVPTALGTYFGYSCGPYEDKANYSDAGWYSRIAASVDAGRPVFYAFWQADYSGGHAVVCDGYRNGNEIHLNLGWSGSYNAWYNLNSVSAGGYTWTIHGAVFDITPPGSGAPANDLCSGARILASGVTSVVDTAGATTAGDPAPTCGGSLGRGAWYRFTPANSGTVTVNTCGSDFDTILSVYTGSCGSWSEVACDDDSGCANFTSRVTFNGVAGTTYYVLAGGFAGIGGTLRVAANLPLPSTPQNDLCSGAATLSNGGSAFLNTATATSSGDPTPGCGSGVGKGVWYKVTPGNSGTLSVNTCGSTFDTVLAVYAGTCGALSALGCNDDNSSCSSGSSLESAVSVPVSAGTTYYIFVGGYGGDSGNLQIFAQWTTAPQLGSLNVICGPAASLGSWQVDGGSVQSNRATASGLSVGPHIVHFLPVSGWLTPGDLTVIISNGITRYASGIYARPGVVRFADDFNDGSFSADRWGKSGYNVVEGGGLIAVRTDVTDQPGTLFSQPLVISGRSPLTIRRRAYFHHDDSIYFLGHNQFFSGRWTLNVNGVRPFGTQYDAYDYGSLPRHGFFLARNDAAATDPAAQADVSAGLSPIWDGWFDEKLVYQPATGLLDYYVNNVLRLSMNVGSAFSNACGAASISMNFQAYGWWTGHYQLMDDLSVVQDGTTLSRLRRSRRDLDGDFRSDVGCFDAVRGTWYFQQSAAGFTNRQFGFDGTQPLTGDFDGDGRSDYGCYYPPGGYWYLMQSTAGFTTRQFGYGGTVPVTGDFDGDGRDDYGCYYPPGGYWYLMQSTAGFATRQFGYGGTMPVTGDFDGDGRCDYGCYYPPGGNWYFMLSSEGFTTRQFGYGGTMPITGDFDGDGRCDYGCYYPPGGNWYFMLSSEGFTTQRFGYSGTLPVTGDFDGDGRDDYGCYHPGSGSWYLMRSRAGFMTQQFGYAGTVPVP